MRVSVCQQVGMDEGSVRRRKDTGSSGADPSMASFSPTTEEKVKATVLQKEVRAFVLCVCVYVFHVHAVYLCVCMLGACMHVYLCVCMLGVHACMSLCVCMLGVHACMSLCECML